MSLKQTVKPVSTGLLIETTAMMKLIQRSEADIQAGRVYEHADVFNELCAKYGNQVLLREAER